MDNYSIRGLREEAACDIRTARAAYLLHLHVRC